MFSTAQLTPGRGENGLPERDWRAAVPQSLPLTQAPKTTDIYHFLLPAEGMGMVSDRVVRALEPAAFEQFRQWRRSFTAPLTKDEVRRVQALSQAAEKLWQQHAEELSRVRKATCDELHVWPDLAENRAPPAPSRRTISTSARCLAMRRKTPAPIAASNW